MRTDGQTDIFWKSFIFFLVIKNIYTYMSIPISTISQISAPFWPKLVYLYSLWKWVWKKWITNFKIIITYNFFFIITFFWIKFFKISFKFASITEECSEFTNLTKWKLFKFCLWCFIKAQICFNFGESPCKSAKHRLVSQSVTQQGNILNWIEASTSTTTRATFGAVRCEQVCCRSEDCCVQVEA